MMNDEVIMNLEVADIAFKKKILGKFLFYTSANLLYSF